MCFPSISLSWFSPSFFVDIFDTLGTLIGCASKADMLDKDGKLPRIKGALLADAIGTTVGAVLGTSTITTFVESSSGIAEGGTYRPQLDCGRRLVPAKPFLLTGLPRDSFVRDRPGSDCRWLLHDAAGRKD